MPRPRSHRYEKSPTGSTRFRSPSLASPKHSARKPRAHRSAWASQEPRLAAPMKPRPPFTSAAPKRSRTSQNTRAPPPESSSACTTNHGVLVVRIEDDGRGFDPAQTPDGAGLRNIRERVQTLDGTLRLTSTPGHGTVLTISLPWPPRQSTTDPQARPPAEDGRTAARADGGPYAVTYATPALRRSCPPSRLTRRSRSKAFVGLLVVVAVIGVVVSIAAWCFLEAIFQIQQELYVHLPHAVGYQNGPPKWWSLPVLAVGALIVALAITRLPGDGGHIPAKGLSTGGPSGPDIVPGVLLAGPGDDRLRAGARAGGPADRVGRGSRGRDDQPGSPRHAAAGADAGRGRRELRRDVVHLRLPADRGGDPDRGDRDRRPQAPAPAGPRTAGGRNRVARVARNRVVVGAEHARLRARPASAVRARPPDGRSVRVDDRVGDRRRGRYKLCDARRSAHAIDSSLAGKCCCSCRRSD